MTPNDETHDQELLARYRRASDADAAGPSETVRMAILAESRRVAAELAKQAPQQPFDVSRPAANDSRWKITAFGTVGAALLAALLFAPRYWESAPPAQVSWRRRPAPAAARDQHRTRRPSWRRRTSPEEFEVIMRARVATNPAAIPRPLCAPSDCRRNYGAA